jgi:hypothetical protein
MSVLKTIGLMADVLGIWSFFADQVPSPSNTATVFRIAVGLDGTRDPNTPNTALSNAGGAIDSIRVYNGNGALIGVGSLRDPIGEGGFSDAVVRQEDLAQQAVWTDFYAGDDAVCIAYITATWHDSQKWGWTGDWGSYCGLPGYPSGIFVRPPGYGITIGGY